MGIGIDNIASVRAGTLRHQIVIQQPASVQNTRGEMVPGWTTFATIRCRVIPMTGNELESAQQILAKVSHRIDARWHAGITPDMRVSYGTRYLDIGAIVNINELSREMQLYCIERVGEQ